MKSWIYSVDDYHDLYKLENDNWTELHRSRCPSNLIPIEPHYTECERKWISGDHEHRYEENIDWIVKNNWHEQDIKYIFNKQGFRDFNTNSDITKETGGVLYLGCSIVFGVGLNLDQSFSWLAHNQLFPDKRYLNFGLMGCGVDTFYRIFKSYYDVVKPDIVVVSWPWAHLRTEVFDIETDRWDTINLNRIEPNKKISTEHTDIKYLNLFVPEVSVLRYCKNLEAIQWI